MLIILKMLSRIAWKNIISIHIDFLSYLYDRTIVLPFKGEIDFSIPTNSYIIYH